MRLAGPDACNAQSENWMNYSEIQKFNASPFRGMIGFITMIACGLPAEKRAFRRGAQLQPDYTRFTISGAKFTSGLSKSRKLRRRAAFQFSDFRIRIAETARSLRAADDPLIRLYSRKMNPWKKSCPQKSRTLPHIDGFTSRPSRRLSRPPYGRRRHPPRSSLGQPLLATNGVP